MFEPWSIYFLYFSLGERNCSHDLGSAQGPQQGPGQGYDEQDLHLVGVCWLHGEPD